ncbi:peptidase, S54 family [Ancylostoma duodenale]|uniref:Peptidase, S54 family n=1 Tax=Ancylostoma duodenale TaxID=51022 RepID=A0A0C2G3A7_9BILA|nr:peptidase, S54 family [Ancylostoma duodenale]
MIRDSSRYRSHYRAQFQQLRSPEDPQPLEEVSIPLDVLRSRLRKQRGSIKLRDDQIEALLNQADKNGDRRITMSEFEELMTSKEAQSSQVKRALYLIADQVITPSQQPEVHSYIDEYTCCPPPLFIILVTIIESSGEDIFAMNPPDPSFLLRQCPSGFSEEQSTLGSLLQYTLDPKVYVVGASAGVYALLTAHLANVVINWAEMPYRWVRLTLISIFLAFDITTALVRRFCSDQCDTVSHSAHIAGGITGFCFGVVILYNIVVGPLCFSFFPNFVASWSELRRREHPSLSSKIHS